MYTWVDLSDQCKQSGGIGEKRGGGGGGELYIITCSHTSWLSSFFHCLVIWNLTSLLF